MICLRLNLWRGRTAIYIMKASVSSLPNSVFNPNAGAALERGRRRIVVMHPLSELRRIGRVRTANMAQIKVSVLFFLALFATSAFAQAPLIRIVAAHLAWLYSTEATASVKCPTGYFPITYAETPQFFFDFDTVYQRELVNSAGSIAPRATLSSASSLMGGGVTLDDYNEEH